MRNYCKILFLTLSLLFSLNFISDIKATSGEIVLNKEATKIDQIYGRSADVKLSVVSDDFNLTKKTDVILVIDRSSSMNNKANSKDKLTKIGATKQAAKNLVNNLLTEQTKDNVRIGVVVFGSDLISSLELSSNKDQINTFIGNISNNAYNEGTNVQIGLKTAKDMLNGDNSKYVILLSDGEPTFYTDDNGIRHGTGSSDEYECTSWNFLGMCTGHDGPKPSQMALKEATQIKELATLYTISFSAGNGQNFLKKVASSNGFFNADNEEELLKNFDEISKKINLIATDVVVTDTIPEYFKLDTDSLKQQYGESVNVDTVDGKTVITWTIGDLYSTNTPTLEYQLEAILPHYGNMYTNTQAVLTGNASDGNPFYTSSDGKINLNFPKPVVDIPAVTENDDYGSIYQGETLKITTDNSLLKNDYLTKNEEKYKVTDEIVIVNKNHSSLDNLVVNNDGTFEYNAPTDYTGEISFDYYIKSTIIKNNQKSEVISNTSTVTFTVVKKETNYTVNYLEKNTNKILATSKQNSGYVYDSIVEKAIDIKSYKVLEPSQITLKLQESNNVINFYYEKIIPTINESIDKTGTDKIEAKEQSINYKINYQTTIDNYVGNGKLIITDQLPYEIDLTKSSLNGGIYDQENKTITWEIEFNNIDTYENGSKVINFTKDISLVFIGIEGTTRNIENKVNGKLELADIDKDAIYDEHLTKVEIKSQVIAKYQDENGQEIAKEETQTDLVGVSYETNPKDIEGYELIEVIGNETGVLIESDITVIYKYQKLEPKVEQEVVKNGTDKIENINDSVNYNLNYQSNINDFKGNFTLIVTDYLPYEIDLTKSSLNGGIYDQENKTITWSIDYKDINTYQNGLLKLSFNKDITLVYKNIDPQIRTLENKIGVKLEGLTNEEINDTFETQVLVKGKVTAIYVDEEGNSLIEPIVQSGLYGEDYQTTSQKIDGYNLLKVVGNETGKLTSEDITVKYIYGQNKGLLTVKYVDEKGNELLPSIIQNGKVGEKYQTEAKTIKGYQLLRVDGKENGEYTKDETVVTYVYEQIKGIPFTKVIGDNYKIGGFVLSMLGIISLIIFRKKLLKS